MTVLSKSISSYRSVIAAIVVVTVIAVAVVVVVVAAYERYRDKKSCQEGVENLWRDSAAKSSNSNFLLAREENEGKKIKGSIVVGVDNAQIKQKQEQQLK